MASKHLAGLVAIMLLGAGLRVHGLAQDIRFHPDEALFVTFARQAAVQGDWLLHGTLDKPPLTIYVNALALTAFGITTLPNGVLTLDVHSGEFAARVPGVYASVLLIAVGYALGKRLYKGEKRTQYIVPLLLALSPLAVAFGAAAFTDELMLLCVTLALWMGVRRQWIWAGIWIAAGLWCKQQAVLYVPLVIGIGWLCERRVGRCFSVHKGLRFGVPIVLGLGLLVAWDSARGQDTSLWTLATVNNDPGRLASVDELLPRLVQWWQYGQYLVGGAIVTAVLGIAATAGLIKRVSNFSRQHRLLISRDLWLDGILAGYIVVYLAVHWLVAINIYDRYLLLILLPVLLLVSRGINTLTQNLKGVWVNRYLVLIIAVICLPTAWMATEGKLPIGGDGGRHNGIEQVADYLNGQRLGAIVYDHWLGWELGYYMGTWSDKRRVYYPTPDALLADALLQPDRAPRYFIVPEWADATMWLNALRKGQFTVAESYQQGAFAVYELLPP